MEVLFRENRHPITKKDVVKANIKTELQWNSNGGCSAVQP